MQKTLLLVITFHLSAVSFVLAQNKIVWINYSDSKIYTIDDTPALDGTPEPVTAINIPQSVAFFNANTDYPFFYTAAYNVFRNTADGTHQQSIYNQANQFLTGVAIDYVARKVYWAHSVEGLISRANLDGSNKETLLSDLTKPQDIELDLVNQKIYWTEAAGGGKIHRANLSDGGNVTTVGPVPESNLWCQGIAVDPVRGKFYYSDLNSRKVFAANIDGTGGNHVEIISSGIKSAGDIDVDYATGKLYFTDYGSSVERIMRFDPDGSNMVSFSTQALFIDYGDLTVPSIVAITRQDPATADVNEGQALTFRVTFSEPMLDVDATDFKLGGVLTGDLAVTHVSEYTVYDVTVSNISAPGVLDLDVADAAVLVDFRGNGLSGTISSEETFTIHEVNDPEDPEDPDEPVGTEQQAGDEQVYIQPGSIPNTMILHTSPLKGSRGYIMVYDATGMALDVKEMLFSESEELSTADYHSGLYVIRVTSGEKRYTRKVIIRD